MKYVCEICGYMYDEAVEGTSWVNLDSTWKCPLCIAPKECFKKVASEEDASATSKSNDATSLAIQKNAKKEDTLETSMSLIHEMAIHNASRIEAMRTHKSVPGWDDILLLGGQLAHPPLADKADVDTTTIIGKNARRPMVLNHAVYVSHMSFGASPKKPKLHWQKEQQPYIPRNAAEKAASSRMKSIMPTNTFLNMFPTNTVSPMKT